MVWPRFGETLVRIERHRAERVRECCSIRGQCCEEIHAGRPKLDELFWILVRASHCARFRKHRETTTLNQRMIFRTGLAQRLLFHRLRSADDGVVGPGVRVISAGV